MKSINVVKIFKFFVDPDKAIKTIEKYLSAEEL